MQMFAIAPASLKLFWFIPLVMIPVAVAAGLLVITLMSARTARFEVSPDGLRLRGDFYGRFIPADRLVASAARRVEFSTAPDLQPRRRTWGTGMPGYQAGWFRLANGERALLYLTDRSRAVYVPTTEGYGLLLSPSDPDRFLDAIRSSTAQ